MPIYMSSQPDSMYHSRAHFRDTHIEMQKLDAGGFGIVYLAVKKNTDPLQNSTIQSTAPTPDSVVVVKYCIPNRYERHDATPASSLRTEIRIMKQLNGSHAHHGILSLVDSHVDGQTQWLTTPYLAGGSLCKFIESHPNAIRIPFIWHVVYSITESLLYMYFGIKSEDLAGVKEADKSWEPISHNYLHTGNVFLRPASDQHQHQFSNFPRLVIADFGESRSFKPGDSTFCYLAAEEFCRLGTDVVMELRNAIPVAPSHELTEKLDEWIKVFDGHIRQGYGKLMDAKPLLKLMLEYLAVAAAQRQINTQPMPIEVETDVAEMPSLEPAGAVEVNYWTAQAAKREAHAKRPPPGLGFEQAPPEGSYVLPGLGLEAPK
ncbi:hypothetical protein LTR17_022855 [Elasticomyces elasticus]|nr:hypothetical protein LTR17_022855 [Elasticomyces elasticus]